MSGNKYLLENSYNANYDAAKKFVAQNNLPAAKEAFTKAALAAGELMKISSGVDLAKYKANATSIVQMIDQIDMKIRAAQEEKKVVANNNANNAQKEEKKDGVEAPPKISVEEALKKLSELEGLQMVKQQVNEFITDIQFDKMKVANGMPTIEKTHHMVFMGNPGTGKTTVARIMGQILQALGIVSKGQLIEVTRQDLVAGYVGQTAIKTQECIDKAIGGVLFIDEAYTLYKDGGNDFGQESIDTLLKATDGSVKDLVVIIAGYDDLMDKFIESNPGLKSRFTHNLNFTDYDGASLFNIFSRSCKKNGYIMTAEAAAHVRQFFEDWYRNRGANFGNARDVRNIFNYVDSKHAKRVIGMGSSATKQDIQTITRDDLLSMSEARKLLNLDK